MYIKTIEEYNELKKEYLEKEKELYGIVNKLEKWEKTRPENIKLLESRLMPGYKVDYKTGNIYSDIKNKQFLIDLNRLKLLK